MADFDDEDWDDEVAQGDSDHQRIDRAPDDAQKLGPWTVVALILNRTIGSGIFVTPIKVLNGTGSVGASLLLWTVGGIIGTAGLLCWLELGLSIPLRNVKTTPGSPAIFARKSVPRNGGERNYLEFIYSNPETGRPKFLVTCMYGIVFILLGNLSGNAVAFGSYIMEAAGNPDASKGTIIAIAISGLTGAILLHVCSRRGGILMNNFFAITKVLVLIAIIILGFVKASSHPQATADFKPSKAFQSSRHDLASYTDSFLFIVYTYSGFEQPFYVLAEVRTPRKVFPTYTLLAMFIATLLFILINITYFCAVPKDLIGIQEAPDMATVFFSQVFGEGTAPRVMAALIAFSILGNIVVMTFTAARVKQEIAKEGILPYSLFFATGHTTPWAWLKNKWFSPPASEPPPGLPDAEREDIEEEKQLEQTPMAALALHWTSSLLLIAATSSLAPTVAYSVLVSLYSYVIIVLNGFFVSLGLLILKLSPSRKWNASTDSDGSVTKGDANIRFWLDPLHAVLYCTTCGFLLIAAFFKPGQGSPYSYALGGIEWWIVPVLGMSTLGWGVLWWYGLKGVMWRRMKDLVVSRRALVVQDRWYSEQYVQKGEIVSHEWHTRVPAPRPGFGGFEMGDVAQR